MNFKKILSQVNGVADWVGLRYVEENQNILSTKKFSLDNVQRNTTKGVMIDVLVNGQFSYYATPFLDEKHILDCINIACNNAKLASKFSVFKFDHDSVRKGYEGVYKTNLKTPLSNLSINDIKDLAFNGSKTMMNHDKRIIHAGTTVELIERTTEIVSTNGADISQKMDIVLVELSSTAQDKNESQTRSNHGMRGHCFQAGAEFIEDVIDGENLSDMLSNLEEESNWELELTNMDCNDEPPEGTEYIAQLYSSEKGTFFEGIVETTGDFDPKKLKIHTTEYLNGEDTVTSIEYNEVDVDNGGGDTNGKGYSAHVWSTVQNDQ